ncbi:hypothetical protein LOZ31_006382 [Ophidiomyces ophidiicola]|nr:hypothetical protein LOZ31_006382 [Ophidiomyces ophidiicola]
MSSGKGRGENPRSQRKTSAPAVRPKEGTSNSQPSAPNNDPQQSNADDDDFTTVEPNRCHRNFPGRGSFNESLSRHRGGNGSNILHRGGPGNTPALRGNSTGREEGEQRESHGGGYQQSKGASSQLYSDMNPSAHHNIFQAIASLENRIVDESLSKDITQKLGASSNKRTLPTKPVYGTNSREVDLCANYFEIDGVYVLIFYKYNVHLEENMSLRIKRHLFTLLLRQKHLNDEAVATSCHQRWVKLQTLLCSS